MRQWLWFWIKETDFRWYKYDEIKGISRKFKEFDKSVAVLAVLKSKHKSAAKKAVEDIIKATAATLSTVSVHDMAKAKVREYGKRIFYEPIIKNHYKNLTLKKISKSTQK